MTTQYLKLPLPKLMIDNSNVSNSESKVNVENARRMKYTNDEIDLGDHDLMRAAACEVSLKCAKALTYGSDMRSSRLLLLRDAQAILNAAIDAIDSSPL